MIPVSLQVRKRYGLPILTPPAPALKGLGTHDQRGGGPSSWRVRCRRCHGHAGSGIVEGLG